MNTIVRINMTILKDTKENNYGFQNFIYEHIIINKCCNDACMCSIIIGRIIMTNENINKLVKIYFDTQSTLADILANVCKYDDKDYNKCEKTLKEIQFKLDKINAKL